MPALEPSPLPIDTRQHSLQQALTDAGLDALICTNPSDVLLLTGFWPVMSDTVAIFTREGETHLIVPQDEQELAAQMSRAKLTPYEPEKLTELTSPAHQLKVPLAAVSQQLGLTSAVLGMRTELGLQPAAYLTATDFRNTLPTLLDECLPAAHHRSCDDLLDRQQATRTLLELQTMRLACRIAAEAFAAAEDAIQPGLREAEVASMLQSVFDTSPLSTELHRSYGFFFCMSGPHSATAAAAYARTRQRILETGDLVMIHANTCADGLWTDITRTYTVGQPLPRHDEMRSAIEKARAAALAAIHPGVPAHEVDRAARQVMEAHGLGKAFKHATGHGVGFAAAYANALPRIHPCSPDTLAAGMTFNVEPAAYFDNEGGMRHCDVVAVTADGHEVLTAF